ncbi:universal stress protein [Natronorarus salvus]|uniref:universal stress protein n=1 Tax=Natronorarus salvus TaxID=3117733 RepID=UPI002F263D73
MYHVLVPIDDDERRVRSQAETILGLAGAAAVRADVLYVHEEIETPADEAGSSYIEEINRNLEEIQGLPETADLLVELLREANVETAVHGVTGEPEEAILAVAAEVDADAIVLGGRRRSPVGKAIFGSVTQAVILDADRTVMVSPT